MTESTSVPRTRTVPDGLIVTLVLALLVALLWLPFGLNVGFVQDDWINFHQMQQGTMMSHTAPTRLLTPIPWTLAYGLNPGQAAGINLFQALMIFGKGWLVYRILLRLNAAKPLAFAGAVLLIVLPADTGVFYMGALAIQFSVFSFLLALYLLLVFRHTGRLSALIGMMLAQLCCVAIYELAYPLIAFAPLTLLFLKPRLDRKFVRATVLWYLIPFLYGLYYLWLTLNFPRAFAYQDSLIQRPTILEMLSVVDDIYLRHFITGWLPQGALSATLLVVSVIAGIGVAGVSFWLGRHSVARFTSRQAILLVVSGLVIIGLGIVMYLPTSLRTETLRTFYYSSIGAALTLAVLFVSVARRPLILAVLVGVFAAFGTLNLLQQHQIYVEASQQQEVILTRLAQVVPNPAPESGIVIIDESSDQFYLNFMRGTQYTEDMLPLMYGDPSLEGALCLPSDFGSGENSRCRFNAAGLTLPSTRTWMFDRSYDQLIFVRYDGAFSVIDDLSPYRGEPVTTYQPQRLYDPAAPLPAAIHDLFGVGTG